MSSRRYGSRSSGVHFVCRYARCHSAIYRPLAVLASVAPASWHRFATLNNGKSYGQQIKPFNFGLTCFVRAFGHPPGADPTRFHLYAPYETDPRRWTKMDWIEQYSGGQYTIPLRESMVADDGRA